MKAAGPDDMCELVIGNTTQALIGDSFTSIALGSFALKGKSQLIECFQIEGSRPADGSTTSIFRAAALAPPESFSPADSVPDR